MPERVPTCPICGCPDRAWLTIPVIARALKLSWHTIERLCHAGELDGYRIRGTWRVRHSSLDEYLQRQSARTHETT